MWKFFSVFVSALAVMFFCTSAEAADIPNFAQVGGSYLTFTGREDAPKHGKVVYGYDCSVDLKENFAEQYMNYLVQNYPFQFISHDYKDYMSTSATIREQWMFKYVGAKQVRTFDARKYGSATAFIPCHLSVSRSKNFQTGITHFSIRIATGLTYDY